MLKWVRFFWRWFHPHIWRLGEKEISGYGMGSESFRTARCVLCGCKAEWLSHGETYPWPLFGEIWWLEIPGFETLFGPYYWCRPQKHPGGYRPKKEGTKS